MPVYPSGDDANGKPIAAVALTVLFLLGLAGGWALLAKGLDGGGRDLQVELPGRR